MAIGEYKRLSPHSISLLPGARCGYCGEPVSGNKAFCGERCATRGRRGVPARMSCMQCGVVFLPVGARLYCGPDCAREARNAARRLGAAPADRRCRSCGCAVDDDGKTGRKSVRCTACKLELRTAPRPQHRRTCAQCSAEFVAHHHTAKWCSKACGKKGRRLADPSAAQAANAQRQSQRRERKSADPMHGKPLAIRRFTNALKRVLRQKEAAERVARPCAVCGNEIGAKRSRYCSRACRDASPVTLAVRRRTGRAYQAAKRVQTVESFDPLDILNRDGWTCQLCGVATPKRLRGTADPRAPEVDHIVPLAKQGAHAPWNAQCACRRCNRAKSDRALGQLLMFG